MRAPTRLPPSSEESQPRPLTPLPACPSALVLRYRPISTDIELARLVGGFGGSGVAIRFLQVLKHLSHMSIISLSLSGFCRSILSGSFSSFHLTPCIHRGHSRLACFSSDSMLSFSWAQVRMAPPTSVRIASTLMKESQPEVI